MSAPVRPTWRSMISRPHQMIALSFGLGLMPVAPGTAGAIGGFALFAALQALPLYPRVAAYIALVALASWAAWETGRDLGAKDDNSIVVDETLGMSLVLEFAPWTFTGMGAAFLLFRIFDVWKPWPVYLADRGHRGGFFVIFDDILAAGWAVICLLLLVRLGAL
jgi:phosphatidylglycerophosphatase A